MGQPILNGGYYYSPSGGEKMTGQLANTDFNHCGIRLVWGRKCCDSLVICRGPGTPYTYQNGMAMFTSDTGQQAATLGLLQQLPGKAVLTTLSGHIL